MDVKLRMTKNLWGGEVQLEGQEEQVDWTNRETECEQGSWVACQG